MTLTHAHALSSALAAHHLRVRAAATCAEMEAVLAIRRQVFKVELRMAGESVRDVDDARSVVALATIDLPNSPAHPVGTGRLTLGTGQHGEGVVTWVATDAAYRGRGIGEAVMRFLLDAADSTGAPVILAAQARAVRFYERLGFVPNGEQYLVSQIDHVPMIRHGGTVSSSRPPASSRANAWHGS